MYEYHAAVLRVVDGDTVHLSVDLGFDVHHGGSFRLDGIDAPELSTPEGQAAKEWLVENLPPELRITTRKDRREKFGRYLAVLWSGERNLNEAMIEAGHAQPYDGGRRGPRTPKENP